MGEHCWVCGMTSHKKDKCFRNFNLNAAYLGLTATDVLNWYDEWHHTRLAKLITTLWASKNNSSYKKLIQEVNDFSFNIDSYKFFILNKTGECEILENLNALILNYPLSEYNTPQNQMAFVKILDKKLPSTIYRQDMEAQTDLPRTNV